MSRQTDKSIGRYEQTGKKMILKYIVIERKKERR